mmetsp:Transcript_33135/g.85258  ORF Transcript_33135/g.85258 Transcript_33135/m.85258 type:complete len:108 (-) Transcript_33135:362-685(-)|eukprot:CAMPEP_0113891374 /NCGR_PEP_ID=MMETSP0780_2-20120614/14718_1 /TAXON_ID=652834 /ORGANISM="Palpitomonas bilix" /LENGTH=107 /DNA_ID=CAMNT_0000880979 /DNA_START=489 /DNA_END=812 /DNA_ORIENTATION=- /assembly_acc=CAM_ASM_000599
MSSSSRLQPGENNVFDFLVNGDLKDWSRSLLFLIVRISKHCDSKVVVLIGVTRFVKNGRLSGLNNLIVSDVISPGNLSATFGFMQSDIMNLLKQCSAQRLDMKDLEE